MKAFSKANTIALILLITLGAVSHASPDDAPSWYPKVPQAYEPIREEMMALIIMLREEGIPQDTVGLLVLEGVAKSIDPPRLIQAVKAQADRLLWLNELLQNSGYIGLNEPEFKEALERLSLYLQSGVAPVAIESLFKDRPDLEKALYTGEALGKIVQFAYSTSEDQLRLAKAIVASNIPPRRYAALVSTVLRGLSAGFSPERLLDILVEVLSSGGGMLQIDQEIRSRGRG